MLPRAFEMKVVPYQSNSLVLPCRPTVDCHLWFSCELCTCKKKSCGCTQQMLSWAFEIKVVQYQSKGLVLPKVNCYSWCRSTEKKDFRKSFYLCPRETSKSPSFHALLRYSTKFFHVATLVWFNEMGKWRDLLAHLPWRAVRQARWVQIAV